MVETRTPAEVFPPGDWIREGLEDRGWTQSDLAEILGRPIQMVNELIAGKKSITPETAKGLAQAFGTTAQFWLNLDAAYQLYVTRDADPNVGLRARLYLKAPVREMVKRGWLESSTNPRVLEQRLLDFFGIYNLDESPKIMPAAARMSTSYESLSPAQWAWLSRAKELGATIPLNEKFEPTTFQTHLGRLRSLLTNAEDISLVPQVLADAGIRFVVVEHLSKTRIDGACLWLDSNSPLIALSLRYDRVDYFWFTLMHELKHALARDGLDSGELTVDIDLVGESRPSVDMRPAFEEEADRFAEEALISQPLLDDFITRKAPLFSEQAVRAFAAYNKVHPGLVVGQLQYRGLIAYSSLRTMLVKIRDFLVETAVTDGWGRPSLLPDHRR